MFVHGNGVLATEFQALDGSRNNRVRRYTYGNYGHINIKSNSSPWNSDRTTTSRSIRLTEFHLLKNDLLHGTLFVGNVFQWVVESEEFDTFFLGVLHFFETSRHFGFATTINDEDLFSTETLGGTARVHSGITTTHYHYILGRVNRSIGIRVRSIHQVHASEVFVR